MLRQSGRVLGNRCNQVQFLVEKSLIGKLGKLTPQPIIVD